MENKTIVLDGIEYELVLKEDTQTESGVEKSRFKPFDLTIRLNTIEEVKSLWNRLNISDKEAYEKNIEGGEGYKLDNDETNEEAPFYTEWDKLDDILRELGEETTAKEIVEESKLEFIQKHLAKIVGRIYDKDSDEITIGKDINFNLEHGNSFWGHTRKCCNLFFQINPKGNN